MIEICDLCGNPIEKPIMEIEKTGKRTLVCPNCKSLSGTCARCIKSSICAFNIDPSPIPKFIQKQIQRGPMISVTQIKNPDRIRATCENGCPCFDSEIGCLKEYNTCGNYHPKEEENCDE